MWRKKEEKRKRRGGEGTVRWGDSWREIKWRDSWKEMKWRRVEGDEMRWRRRVTGRGRKKKKREKYIKMNIIII